MEVIKGILDLFLHLDKHLGDIILKYDTWTYLILFCILFAETGLVVTPFLPGDSLLFAAGAFAAVGKLDYPTLFLILFAGALIGDNLNYAVGKYLGPRLFRDNSSRFFNRQHLERTHHFYDKHGPKTVILARFVPIVRTFAPFVAGIGTMRYRTFLAYSIGGGLFWVTVCTAAGYFFGNLEPVKKNFSLVILVIVAISVLPMLLELRKHRMEKSRADTSEIIPAPSTADSP